MRAREQRRGRRKVHDRAAAGRAQMRQRRPADEKRSGQVYREHPVPVREGELLDRSELDDAGRVQDAVDPAEPLASLPHGVPDRGFVGHVAGEPDGSLELRGDRFRPSAVEIEDGDPAALGGEAPGGGGGNPRAAAGREQDLAVEAGRQRHLN